jgi:4-amino-4-deoxy-L-arabinose transferase-like glycosyltransferase
MTIVPSLKRYLTYFQNQRQIISHAIFLLIWLFNLYTGAMGIDFRSHWDERKLFKSIRESIPVGKILPGWYNYPSMIYDLTVLSAAPEILTTYLSDRSTFRENMEKQLLGQDLRKFTLRARMVFLVITTLTIVWTYLLVLIWAKHSPQALLSSAILASSWEFAYHARWIAPDAILMQFGMLAILLVFLALNSTGRRKFIWLMAAVVAAGLACATKYFGGIFLVPVFIGGYRVLRDTGAKWGSYIALFFVLAAIFSLTFLLITPGTLMDTARMIVDVRYEIGHYQTGDTGYTVNAGWQHFSLLFIYLLGVFFSKYFWISLLFSGLVLIGLYNLLTRNWKAIETWVFLSVPLLFIPYVSQQRVMMVRNDLLLFPFLAILCARGVNVLWNSRLFRSNRIARVILAVGLLLALLVNFNWLYYAGRSISPNLTNDWSQMLPRYLLANKDATYYLSAGVRRELNTNELPNVVSDPLLADKLVFVFDEVDHPLANRPNVYDPIFGPYEVNFDYYPSWNEDERILVMPMKAALLQEQFGFIDQ